MMDSAALGALFGWLGRGRNGRRLEVDMTLPRCESRDGMRISWDVPIEMSDGAIVRCDIYRPCREGTYPVLLSYGPYAKGLHFMDGYPIPWKILTEKYPEVVSGVSGKYMNWETVDPERWVPFGYACVRVDSRGSGRSPGRLEPWSPRQTRDLYECIEWAGSEAWSNGRVGLSGVSYYAMNQWMVGALGPPHLRAMCVWEGAADLYRDFAYHGGILSVFGDTWFRDTVVLRQHGRGNRDYRSRVTGEWVTGPETLTEDELAANRCDFGQDLLKHPLIDDYWAARLPDLSKISVPLLSAGNWGGAGIHLRGNVLGFLEAGTSEKWLEMHGGEHFASFYTDEGVALQKRFFDWFLRDEDSGWCNQPRVTLNIRRPGESFQARAEDDWPIPRTQWRKLYLHPEDLSLSAVPPSAASVVSYVPRGEGLTFLSRAFEAETEVTGPLAARINVSADAEDTDIFLVLRLFAPDMREVTFIGASEPHVPVAMGWLRASHREVDAVRARPYQPVHPHRTREPLRKHEICPLDVEILPTSIVVPEGYRIGLSVRGRDYVYPGFEQPRMPTSGRVYSGVGPCRHVDPTDRAHTALHGEVTLHSGPDLESFLLLPVIP